MTTLFIVLSVIQSMVISLGVGASTIAIVYYLFLTGPSDDTRRHMTKLVYTMLRVAMVAILLTTALLGYILYTNVNEVYLTTYHFAIWTYVFVLFANAILMTLHLMPRLIGPGLQAATWYALGITVALPSSIVVANSYVSFSLWYLGFVGFAILTVNLIHAYKNGDLS